MLIILHIHFLFYRNEDLKQMLESNKDSAKLEAMKRIVGVCSVFIMCIMQFASF